MGNAFYNKLAFSNLRNHKSMYGPYFLAAVIMSAMYFIILNIVFSQSIANMTYGLTMQGMFSCGIVVMSFFTIGYMLYINSFLIKRRKKEFGLYAILGLEKRHVGQIILRENFILNICAVAFGLLVGIILGKLVMVVLLMLLHTAPGSYYQISPMALVVTGLLFGGIFILTTFYNLLQVRMANPVDLMQGEKKGERKLRGVIPFTIAGLLLLLSGYGAAILVNSSAAALVLFWPAVLVVIMATWLLFIVGSNFLLTRLQNNKQFYYQPDNFIAVSGLLHRLRQHAGGLANICILSTMVIVTVSCCTALFFGQESILRQNHPADIKIVFYDEDSNKAHRQAVIAGEQAEILAIQYGLTLVPLAEQELPESAISFNVSGDSVAAADFAGVLKQQIAGLAEGGYSFSDIFESRNSAYALYGGLLFLGVFFALLFLTNTVLIIYFKQVSESYDDRERFAIMQKVGMDDVAVKRAIDKQVRIVFFLPLAVAIVHMAAASHMIIKLMECFGLLDAGITLLCIGCTTAVFSLVYICVFRITARTCYRMLKC